MRSAAACALLLVGCVTAPPAGAFDVDHSPRTPSGESELEAGGALRFDQISVAVRHGEVEARITPLDDRLLRLAAPDVRRSLLALRRSELPALDGSMVLITFVAFAPDQPFSPTDLRLEVDGRRLQVLEIRPITTGWERQRLDAREAMTALYLLAERLDPFVPFRVRYGDSASDRWRTVLTILHAEERRISAIRAD